MGTNKEILLSIKKTVQEVDAEAIVILYGSYARGDENVDSDIDILILVNKTDLTRTDKTRLKYPLYEIEFETGKIISPLVFSKKDWETRHKITPFYENVNKEGIRL
jgi:predicted nucleotidyltransferase